MLCLRQPLINSNNLRDTVLAVVWSHYMCCSAVLQQEFGLDRENDNVMHTFICLTPVILYDNSAARS